MSKEKSLSKIRIDADKSPISHLIIVTLFAIGLVSLPIDLLIKKWVTDERMVYYISQAIPRVIFSVVAIIIIAKYNFAKIFKSFSKMGLLLILPALLVCVNNAPIVGIISGSVTPNCSVGLVFAYLAYCISVGFYEELIFRGIILPLCIILLKKAKNGIFWAVVLASAIFSLSHIVNLFSGMGIGAVALQLGYTFLIGGMCAICTLKVKNIFPAVVLHTIYDIGGLALLKIGNSGGLFSGNQWDVLTVIITAVLGIAVGVYMFIMLLKINKKSTLEVRELYNIQNEEQTIEQKEAV